VKVSPLELEPSRSRSLGIADKLNLTHFLQKEHHHQQSPTNKVTPILEESNEGEGKDEIMRIKSVDNAEDGIHNDGDCELQGRHVEEVTFNSGTQTPTKKSRGVAVPFYEMFRPIRTMMMSGEKVAPMKSNLMSEANWDPLHFFPSKSPHGSGSGSGKAKNGNRNADKEGDMAEDGDDDDVSGLKLDAETANSQSHGVERCYSHDPYLSGRFYPTARGFESAPGGNTPGQCTPSIQKRRRSFNTQELVAALEVMIGNNFLATPQSDGHSSQSFLAIGSKSNSFTSTRSNDGGCGGCGDCRGCSGGADGGGGSGCCFERSDSSISITSSAMLQRSDSASSRSFSSSDKSSGRTYLEELEDRQKWLAAQSQLGGHGGERRSYLIVDDCAASRRLTKEILQSQV
jgi:hypothetical protein